MNNMHVNFDSKIAYSANTQASGNKSKNDTKKDVVTGGGAIAATATTVRTRAARSGFDMFNSAKKVSEGMKGVTQATKATANVAKQTKSLWGKVVENAKWAKGEILSWGTRFKNVRFVKNIIKSPIFRGTASALGYGFGLVTLISGLSDITKVTTEAIEGKLLHNED